MDLEAIDQLTLLLSELTLVIDKLVVSQAKTDEQINNLVNSLLLQNSSNVI